MRFLAAALGLLLVSPVLAAPPLSDDDRQRLADETSDRDNQLDQQGGLYVLLRNAREGDWPRDDFSGDLGAAVAPPPDYGFIFENPGQARGNVYMIEGIFAGSDRYPNTELEGRDRLHNTLDPSWGTQVTRWTVAVSEEGPGSTVLVVFNDPDATLQPPDEQSGVRIAARFYKLWSISDADGNPFTYAVFVAGAAEVVEAAPASASGEGPSTKTIIFVAVLGATAAFYIIRRLAAKRTGGGSMVAKRLEQLRREREALESEEDEEQEEQVDDLPDDPVAALDVLRERHDQP